MKNPHKIASFLVLALSLPLPCPAAQAGGKHLEVMAPMCRQNDLLGRPHRVTEHSYESSEGKPEALESVSHWEYDKDGNELRNETFDSSQRKVESQIYTYDAEGTWISLTEEADGELSRHRIAIDAKTRRITKVNSESKQTEFITYSEGGFEVESITRNAEGKAVEKVTLQRNAAGKEEHVLFEEPPGKTTTEFFLEWTPEGFQMTATLIMHDNDGAKIITSYEYPETDAAGNWLTQIQKQVLQEKNGERIRLPTVTVKRTISYHP
ncbi:MAG TPA: hypothetical protein VD994_05120 [Prosthecobacter sp.]|nr:hypothetical protein [Prosthecobacter sp.]